MDKSQVQYLVNLSKQYLDDELTIDNKDEAVKMSQDLFYQTLVDDQADSELKKRLQLFSVLTRQLSQGQPLCSQKRDDLRGTVEFLNATV